MEFRAQEVECNALATNLNSVGLVDELIKERVQFFAGATKSDILVGRSIHLLITVANGHMKQA